MLGLASKLQWRVIHSSITNMDQVCTGTDGSKQDIGRPAELTAG
jgi:hypothetical protein